MSIPQAVKAIANRGESYRLQKQYEAALADFSQAIELKPDYAWVFARRGETYRLMGHYTEALADFNQAIELKPDYAWALAHRGMTYRLMGKAFQKQGRRQEAGGRREEDESRPFPAPLLGGVGGGFYQQALADFSQAIAIQPDYAWAIAYRARIYDLLRRYEEALVDFERAMALDEDKKLFEHWQCERGLLLSYCGRYAEAIACCQEVLKEHPDDSFALYNLAVFKARWQTVAEARPEIDKARSVLLALVGTQEQGLALYRLGGLAAIEGQTEQALSYLQKSILLDQEAIEFAPHDVAWLDMDKHPQFLQLIA